MSNKSKINLIFSLVPLRQIIDKPQQNSRKSTKPDLSLSKSLNAYSHTDYYKYRKNIVFIKGIYFGKSF